MREYQSSVVRSHVDAIRAHAGFERLRAALRPGLLAWVDQPPRQGWVPSTELDELFDAALEIYGPERMREVGKASMQGGLAKFVKPAVRTIFALFGMGPDVVLVRMQAFVGGVERGTQYSYEADGANAGRLVVKTDVPFSVGGMFVFEGAIASLMEMTRREGEVLPHERVDGGREVRISVRWR